MVALITASFETIWEGTAGIPKAYRDGKEIRLFKKGKKNQPLNYRSVYVLDVEGTKLSKVLKNRIEISSDQTPNNLKIGFRSGRMTVQANWNLRI